MIIKDLLYKRGFFFFKKPTLVLVCDQGKGKASFDLSSYNLDEIASKVKGISLETKEDFSKLHLFEDLPLTNALEIAAFNSLKKPLEFFSSDIKQIPRPMHVLLEKKNGIQFLSLSLNASNFDKAAFANLHLRSELSKRIEDLESLSEDQVLDKIQEILKQSNLHFEFEIRLGVNFAGKIPLDQVSFLIAKHNLLYVEQASTSLEELKKLTEQHKATTFICNTLTDLEKITSDDLNAVLLSFSSLLELEKNVKALKEKKINLFYNLSLHEETLAVALGFPIVKITDQSKSIVKKLSKLKDQLKEKPKII